MNRKSVQERARIIQLLVEGNSVRSTSRITDCSINTVLKLLVDVGTAAAEYQDKTLVALSCKRIQIDEIWSFVYAKNRNLRYGMEDYAAIYGPLRRSARTLSWHRRGWSAVATHRPLKNSWPTCCPG